MFFYKQDRVDKFLMYNFSSIYQNLNFILSDLRNNLINVDESKLNNKKYVLDVLESNHEKLASLNIALVKMQLANDNCSFNIDSLIKYISKLRESFAANNYRFTDYDKKTLQRIVNVNFTSYSTSFYRKSFDYEKSPNENILKQFSKLDDICNDALSGFNE